MNSKLPITLAGVVTKFSGNGRKLGYPTANITTPAGVDDGVYFGYADLAVFRRHPSLIFVGTPVTVGDSGRRAEAHLLDVADTDYYGEPISMELAFFHRPNQKLASVEALQSVMRKDEQEARVWFVQHGLGGAKV